MAGLLPRLRKGALPASETWIYLDPMLPGQHPLDALTHTLASHFPTKTSEQVGDILRKEGSYGLHQLATALVPNQKTRLVLTIDQFEELFSPDVPEQERKQLIDLLIMAVTEPRGSLLVLLTLRADFYDRPLAYPALGQLIQQQQCTVLPMELDDLRSVIELPASLPDVWLTFEQGLIGDILFEIRGQVGALPLLEFTLDQLFQRRQGHQLTLQAYQEIGGVKGALAQHAESTYAALPTNKHRWLAQALFVRLITPGTLAQQTGRGKAPPVRRRAPIGEFSFADPAQNRLMQETIDAFLTARLLTTNQITGTTTLEVNHEALIYEWPRLLDWIREAQNDIHLQQMLSSDIAEWERLGRPKDHLYTRSRLKELKAWQERNVANKQEITFLHASARQQTKTRIGVGAIVLLVLLLLVPATAATIPLIFASTVTNLNDNGSGSLRQVIDNVQPNSTITFGFWLRGTILLQKSLQLKKNVTIIGPGADILAISFSDQTGSNQAKDLRISTGTTVNFTNITFKNTKALIPTITNQGNLILKGCSLINNENTLVGGGAIENNHGTLTLIQSTLSGNTVNSTGGFGGAIYDYYGTIVLMQSNISGNKAISSGQQQLGGGGGIDSVGGETHHQRQSYFEQYSNIEQCWQSGGIIIGKGSLTLNNSTITGNTATATSVEFGGGIDQLGTALFPSQTVPSPGTRLLEPQLLVVAFSAVTREVSR